MIEELSKRDSEWRKIALKICGNKFMADDLVNDMYLKLYNLDLKKANKAYVSYCIYHLWINKIKKEKINISIDDLKEIQIQSQDNTEVRLRIDNILNELGLLDREILLHTHEKSLRKTSKELSMCHVKLHYKKQVALDKFLNTNGVKQWLNEG